MPERFSKVVQRVLKKAGWFEGREVDTREPEAYLRQWGFEIHQAARDILREFLGLECLARRTGSWLNFSVQQALLWSVPEQVPAFRRIIGVPLCPVGCGNGCSLLVAASGEVVWLQDEWLGYVRQESFALALDTHFRADYDPAAWVGFSDEEARKLLEGSR